MKKTLISIVIPTKNGGNTIKDCLQSLYCQTIIESTEIIIIDSGSTDSTLEIISEFPIRLYQIEPKSFNHGETRNFGVKLAKGEFVAMTVQDVVFADNKWLEKMVDHFKDSLIAGVCGQQMVPHNSKYNPYEWFRPIDKPTVKEVYFPGKDEFANLSGNRQYSFCHWDDVTTMYRRDVLLKIPFKNLSYGEDMQWAKDALSFNWKLIYDSNIKVYHYHIHPLDHTYQIILTNLYYTYKIFGVKRKDDYNWLQYLKIIYRNFKYHASLKWIVFNFSIYKARHKAHKDFEKYISKDESSFIEFYQTICSSTPIANQNY